MQLKPIDDTCRTAADVRAAARRVVALRRRIGHMRREEISEAPAPSPRDEPVPALVSTAPAGELGSYLHWAAVTIPLGLRFSRDPVPRTPITLRRVLLVAVEHFGVPHADLCSDRKTIPLPDYRAAIFWCARELTERSLVMIGKDIGDRDHSTVSHGVRKVEAAFATGAPLADMAAGLKRAVLSRFAKKDSTTITVSFAATWTAGEGRP